jgi:tRNA A58 N-methylase Trm61
MVGRSQDAHYVWSIKMSDLDPYLLGYLQAEQDRLERQADELAPDSEWLFDQIGVRTGWREAEIGCGPRGCLGLLSSRVGSAGRVVGVERSSDQVMRARRFVEEGRFMNVEVIDADAHSLDLPDR